MLLTIIMATIVLGLLFSGWLAPSPMRAQGTGGGNPPSNNENTNCVATTNAWTGSCPTIVTNGSVSPTTIYQCGVTGPEIPTSIVVPVYSPTNIFTRIITYSTTNCTPDTNTENLTYSVSGYFWTNFSSPYTNMPSKVTNSFSADCDVYVTSSDTNNCASPGLVNLGTVTWILPCPTIANCTVMYTNVATAAPATAGYYGAVIAYNFICADGWYSWESSTQLQGCVSGPTTTDTDASTNNWAGGNSDAIGTQDPSGGTCTFQNLQTIYFAPVGGGSINNNNSTCSFQNIQTVAITQTNYPDKPAHGTVTTTVTIGGGASATYTY